MTPEQIQKILDYLRDTGEIVAKKGYELAVKQIYAQAYGDIFIAVILIIAFILMTVFAIKLINSDKRWSETSVTIHALSLIPLVVALANIYHIILVFNNPEYYAIKLILDLVK